MPTTGTPAAGIQTTRAPLVGIPPAGLPPAYIEVGELDPLRMGSVEYAQNLWAAGVSTELHVLPGLSHGFDMYPLPTVERVMADRIRIISSL